MLKDLGPYKYRMTEEWKSCIEDYEISNRGNVRRKLTGGEYKNINGSIMNRGYRYFQLNRNGKRINYLFHQQVAAAFIGERPDGLVIDHIDRNKLNNDISNLRYITHKENMFNADRVHTDIPQDIPDRHKLVSKKYYDTIKNERNEYRRMKSGCEKCKKMICNGYLKKHIAICDGTDIRHRAGRKKGDKTCIINLGSYNSGKNPAL